MESKQDDAGIEPSKHDFGYIDYYRKSHALETIPELKELVYHQILVQEAFRDYHIDSLRPINNLLQIDRKPNLELTEPKQELYKISVSFWPQGK